MEKREIEVEVTSSKKNAKKIKKNEKRNDKKDRKAELEAKRKKKAELEKKLEKKSGKKYDAVATSEKKKGKKKRSKVGRIIRRILLTIVILLIIAFTTFAYLVHKHGGGLEGVVSVFIGANPNKIKDLEDLTVLCIGKSQNMTDTIMVVKYSPKNQKAAMLSIPRDTFIGRSEASATAYDKINARYGDGGAKELMRLVNELTGLNIKYFVCVDTKAFRDVIDAIGGVDYDVPIDMDYDDEGQDLEIHLKAGPQHLNGLQAEGLVRFRHNNNGSSYPTEYGDNDIGRMRTQREFIKEVAKQAVNIKNITKVDEIINIAKNEVETNIPWDEIKEYLPALVEFNSDNLVADTLPGSPRYINQYSFFVASKYKINEVVDKLFLNMDVGVEDTPTEGENTTEGTEGENVVDANSTETNETPENTEPVAKGAVSTIAGADSIEINSQAKDPSDVTIELINGVGSTTIYNQAVSQLQSRGYKIVSKGTTNLTQKSLIIDRNNNNKDTSTALKNLLCTGIIQKGAATDVDYTVVIGVDYK